MVVFLVEILEEPQFRTTSSWTSNKWRNVGRLMFNSTGEIYPVIVRRYEQSISGWHPSLDLLLGRETGSATPFTSVLECWAYPSHCVSAWYVISRKPLLNTHFVIIMQKRFDYWDFVNLQGRRGLAKENNPYAPYIPMYIFSSDYLACATQGSISLRNEEVSGSYSTMSRTAFMTFGCW